MKPFQFRLKSYLRIKEFEERMSWSEVMTQRSVIHSIQKKIEDIDSQIYQARESSAVVGIKTSVIQAQANQEMIKNLNKKKAFYISDLQAEQAVLDKLEEIHAEIKREKKVIESFKEKKMELHKKLEKKDEAKKMDQIASLLRTNRRKYGSL